MAVVFLFCKGLTAFPPGPFACTDAKGEGGNKGGRRGTWRRKRSEKEHGTGKRLQLRKKKFQVLCAAHDAFFL